MDHLFKSEEYDVLFGSDVERDGVFLELHDRYLHLTGRTQPLLEVFRSDQDNQIMFTVYSGPLELPFIVVERFLQQAQQ